MRFFTQYRICRTRRVRLHPLYPAQSLVRRNCQRQFHRCPLSRQHCISHLNDTSPAVPIGYGKTLEHDQRMKILRFAVLQLTSSI
jgi:hypothetical protein